MTSNPSEKIQLYWCYRLHLKRLSFTLIREICLYLHHYHRLLGVQPGYLALYTLPGNHCRLIPLRHSFDPGTSHCWLAPTELLFIGSGSFFALKAVDTDVYLFDTQSYEITPQPRLIRPRCGPGVVYFRRNVYVFGGGWRFDVYSECEMYVRTEAVWRDIPGMRYPRCLFTPVIYENRVYLPDISQNHTSLETYSPLSNTFETLSINVPSLNHPSLSFLLDDLLVVVSFDMQWCWRIGSSTAYKYKARFGRKMVSSCPPVFVEGRMYWIDSTRGELRSGELAVGTEELRETVGS